MTRISPLSGADGPEVLAFEHRNRRYFARSVPDRGDAYFTEFSLRLALLLAEQEAGTCLFFVVRDDHDRLVGRLNLVDILDGAADLGYRIAEDATGVGHARTAVTLALKEAAAAGVTMVRAMTTVDNAASRRVLEVCGFLEVPGEPAQVEAHRGQLRDAVHYEQRLTSVTRCRS